MNLDTAQMGTAALIGTAALAIFVLSVSFVDLRTHRIPNALCLAGALAGTAVLISLRGVEGVWAALGGMATGLALFLPFYVLRAFGAGDVKAMAAAGAFLGPEQTIIAVAFTLIAGSVIGAAVLLKLASGPVGAFYRVFGVIAAPVSAASRGAEHGPQQPVRDRFPYGVAIAAGVLTSVFCSSGL